MCNYQEILGLFLSIAFPALIVVMGYCFWKTITTPFEENEEEWKEYEEKHW